MEQAELPQAERFALQAARRAERDKPTPDGMRCLVCAAEARRGTIKHSRGCLEWKRPERTTKD